MREELDDEIDLREYIGIVVERKKIVLTVFSVSVFLAAAWSVLSPKIYDVSMIIEPPINAITDTGVQNWDSGLNIKAKIESGAYNAEIINDLNPRWGEPQFEVALPKETGLVKISLKVTAAQTEAGKKMLQKLVEALTRDYAKVIEGKKNRIDNQIKMVLSQIGTKENEIKLRNEQFKLYEAREQQFIEDIRDVKSNSEKLLAKREAVFERKETKDDTAALFYAATIQQNVSYFTQLQNDLYDLKNKKENTLNAAENLKNAINESRIEIGNLNLLKEGVQNISLIRGPYVSSKPVSPKKKQNILIAGIVGLILGILAALSIEYWKNPLASR